MASHRVAEEVRAALAVAEDETANPAERAEMLMEIALGLQQRPKDQDQLLSAVALYDKALTICPPEQALLRARIAARKGTALQAIPTEGIETLEAARAAYDEAIPVLTAQGSPEAVRDPRIVSGSTRRFLHNLLPLAALLSSLPTARTPSHTTCTCARATVPCHRPSHRCHPQLPFLPSTRHTHHFI